MLKKIDKLRDLTMDVEAFLEDADRTLQDVSVSLEEAIGLARDIDGDEGSRIEELIDNAYDKIEEVLRGL